MKIRRDVLPVLDLVYRTVREPSEWTRVFRELRKLGVPASDCLALAQTHELPAEELEQAEATAPSCHDRRALLDMLVPHIRQALALRRQFEERAFDAKAMQDAVGHADFGCILVGRDQTVRWTNPKAKYLVDARLGLEMEAGRLRAREADSRETLQAAIDAALAADADADDQRLRIQRLDGSRPVEVVVSPVRCDNQLALPFPRSQLAMVLVDVPTYLCEELGRHLETLYELTPAEAEVTQWLVSGASPNEIADILDRSPHTIRTHLKRIYAKTDTSSQAELVGQLQRGIARLE